MDRLSSELEGLCGAEGVRVGGTSRNKRSTSCELAWVIGTIGLKGAVMNGWLGIDLGTAKSMCAFARAAKPQAKIEVFAKTILAM